MAKSTLAPSRSEAIRDYLRKHSDAGVKAIQEALREQGIEVSVALVNKVKYRSGSGRKTRGAQAKTKAATKNRPSQEQDGGAEKVNKAAEIRRVFQELGKKARPRDVVAALAEQGITVAPAQVSLVRYQLKLKQAGDEQPGAATEKARAEISGQELLEAKRLADQLGGVDRLRAALEVLRQLA